MSRTETMRPVAAGPDPAAEAAGPRDLAFRKAARHSRLVRVLRWALPAAALGGLALIALFVWLDPLRLYRGLPVDFGRISITDNKLTIEAPKLTGFTHDRRSYLVTAESAAQHLGAPNIVEMSGIRAQVELANRGESALRAADGVYDIKEGSLRLSGGIEIGATGGYQVELHDATVEVRKGHMVTPNPVRALFPAGSLQARRLEVFDHGERVRFDGGVVVTFRLPPMENPPAQGVPQ